MRKLILFLFLLLLTIDTTANVLVKLASDRVGAFSGDAQWLLRVAQEPLVLAIVVCYIAAFITYMSLLKYAPVGPAYAAVHGHVVTVLVISLAFFGERLSLLQGLGCLFIVAGIIVLAVTEKVH